MDYLLYKTSAPLFRLLYDKYYRNEVYKDIVKLKFSDLKKNQLNINNKYQ